MEPIGGPSRIRTDALLITNQMLWPTELSGHKKQDLLGENLVEKTLQTKCFWLIFWAKEMTFCSIHCCIASIAEFAISTISWEIHHISPFSTKKINNVERDTDDGGGDRTRTCTGLPLNGFLDRGSTNYAYSSMVESGIYIEASNSRWRASPRYRASLSASYKQCVVVVLNSVYPIYSR